MGVDTKLYLDTKWTLEDIIKVIERVFAKPDEIISNHSFAPGYFVLTFKEKGRMIHCHTYIKTPLGTATLLDMHSDDEAHKLFKDIAENLGGIFMNNDIDMNCKIINGKAWEEDGLHYFLRYAITQDGIDNHDIMGLLKSMNAWYEKCDPGHKPPILKELIKIIEPETKSPEQEIAE